VNRLHRIATTVDYRLYHWINSLAVSHPWLGHAAATLETWSIPAFAIATVALWLFARPGGDRKWKLACGSALAAAALALIANQAVAHVWNRARPYTAHPDATVFTARSHDPSFPSDHASAAFAIAVAVFLFDRLIGGIFLVAALAIAIGRVVAGVHYPADVLAGFLVGTAAALVVVRLGRPLIDRAVRLVERVTDPVLALAWRLASTPDNLTTE
jgi:membrane-associated phospholipid phosphatase